MDQKKFPAVDPWGPEYLLPYYANIAGSDIMDPHKRALYCRALIFAGNTLRLWNQAVELKTALIAACALEKGSNVLLVGKFIDESGLAGAVKSLIGESGKLTIEDITRKAIDKVQTMPKAQLQWRFNNFDSLPDSSFDRIILFSAVSNIQNLATCAKQISRALKDGGRVIIAEDPIGGEEFVKASHMDAHLEAHTGRILAGLGLAENEWPSVSTANLAKMFGDLKWNRATEASGMFVFHGQKAGGKESAFSAMSVSALPVRAFFVEKPFMTAWDFATPAEVEAWGEVIASKITRDNLARGLFLAGGLHIIYDTNRDVIDTMFDNMKIKRSDKILAIGELFDELGSIRDLKAKFGEVAEICKFDICTQARSSWILGKPLQWDYTYADAYPDEYFDIVWLPQSIHHSNNWSEMAPRLLRVLKPGGQIMMSEASVQRPEWLAAIELSVLMKSIAEKLYIYGNRTRLSEGQLDTAMPVLFEAFGNTLTDVTAVEKKGLMLFWGFKRHYTSGDFPTAMPFVAKKMGLK